MMKDWTITVRSVNGGEVNWDSVGKKMGETASRLIADGQISLDIKDARCIITK